VTETAPRPTLEAVAARAGVSRATVSRVVNGADGVREPLVERVRQAVEELGYVPNQAARSLVTKRHDAVAVVIAEPETRVFADPFFAQQLRGISKELTAHDNQLVLLLTEGRDDHARVGRYLAGGHVDGALVFSLHLDDPLPELIHNAGVPTVFGGRPGWSEGTVPHASGSAGAGGAPAAVYVDSDNRGGAREAVRHLVGLGRTRIAHITGPLDQTSAVDRLDGFRDVMGDAGPRLVAEGDFTPAGGERAMRELLDRHPGLDAVFAQHPERARGHHVVGGEHGRRVPEDVAVVGFDDMPPVAEQTDPPLTTVRQDIETMGRLMARLLLRDLDRRTTGEPSDGTPSGVVLPTTLVRRASAGRVGGTRARRLPLPGARVSTGPVRWNGSPTRPAPAARRPRRQAAEPAGRDGRQATLRPSGRSSWREVVEVCHFCPCPVRRRLITMGLMTPVISDPAYLAEPSAQETLDFVRSHLSEPVVNHSIRGYLYAEYLVDRWDRRSDPEYDAAAVFYALILHDIGLSQAGAERPDRFEVAGADLAGAYLDGNGVDRHTVDRVWEAIALHTSIGISDRRGLITRLTGAATALDFGADSQSVTDAMAADLHRRYPRLNTSSTLHAAITGQARANPAKAPLASLADHLIKLEEAGASFGIASRWGD
jgi:DNA-binding LacI/PurR family transcriptional regulator